MVSRIDECSYEARPILWNRQAVKYDRLVMDKLLICSQPRVFRGIARNGEQVRMILIVTARGYTCEFDDCYYDHSPRWHKEDVLEIPFVLLRFNS